MLQISVRRTVNNFIDVLLYNISTRVYILYFCYLHFITICKFHEPYLQTIDAFILNLHMNSLKTYIDL